MDIYGICRLICSSQKELTDQRVIEKERFYCAASCAARSLHWSPLLFWIVASHQSKGPKQLEWTSCTTSNGIMFVPLLLENEAFLCNSLFYIRSTNVHQL